jgi:hypothetical protein
MKHLIFLFIFAIAAMFAACNTTTPEVTPEQLPVNLEGVFGTPNKANEVLPIWSVRVFFVRNTPFGDYVGPINVQLQLKTKPTLEDAKQYIKLPVKLRGTWSVDAISNVVQIGAKQEPIEQNPPSKSE